MGVYDAELFDAIDSLYGAAAGEGNWEDIAPQIASAFGTHSCSIQIQFRERGAVARLSQTANYTPELTRHYLEHFCHADLWVKRGMARPGVALGSQDIISDDEVLASEFYQDYLRKLGIFYLIGAVIPLGARGEIGIIGIHRPHKAGLFDSQSKARLGLLLPHLRRAFSLSVRLSEGGHQKKLMASVLERLACGVLLVGSQCEILFANSAAERLLREGTGLSSSAGKLRLANGAHAELRRQVHEAVTVTRSATAGNGTPDNLIVIPVCQGRSLSVVVCPAPVSSSASSAELPAAIVFVADSAARIPVAENVLARQFGLSAAELRLTMALLGGRRLQDYADSASISLNTAKTQLKQVFQKTGADRQSELVRAILSNPVLGISGRH